MKQEEEKRLPRSTRLNTFPIKGFQSTIWGDSYRGETQLSSNFIASHILVFLPLHSIEECNKWDFLAIFTETDLTRFHL